jgi:hypothetical protein
MPRASYPPAPAVSGIGRHAPRNCQRGGERHWPHGWALVAARAAAGVAGALLPVTVGLLIDARCWLRLAGRSRVGARSED